MKLGDVEVLAARISFTAREVQRDRASMEALIEGRLQGAKQELLRIWDEVMAGVVADLKAEKRHE